MKTLFIACPACGKPMGNAIFVCGTCWWKVPGNERRAINGMKIRGQETTSKLAKIVRVLRAKAEAASVES